MATAVCCLAMCGLQRQRWVVILVCGLLLLTGTATAKTLPTEPVPEELGGVHPPEVDEMPPIWSGGLMTGMGAIALGVGVWAGLRAMSLVEDSRADCGPGPGFSEKVCGATGRDLRDEATGYAAVSSGFVFGGLALGALGVSVLLSSRGSWRAVTKPPGPVSMKAVPTRGGGLLVLTRLF
jgi:hypothetical protein